MSWLILGAMVLIHVLRLRLDVLLAFPCLLLGWLWLAKAEKTGPQIAVVLTVVVLVTTMLWAEYRCHSMRRRLRCNR